MRAGLSLLLLISACYSAKPQPGTPCTPSLANCPSGQQCALLDGDFVCLDELPGIDAGTDPDMLVPDVPPDGVTPWSLVQTRGSVGVDVDFTASAAGNTIIVGVETSDNEPVDTLTDNVNNEYVRVADSRAINDAADNGIELWYVKSSVSGATRIVAGGNNIHAVVMWEVAGLDKINPLGNVARLSDRPSSTTPLGAPITTTTTGEFVVSIAIVANTVSGLSSSSAFTNDHTTFGNGWAHLTNEQADPGTYQAQWGQPTSAGYCASTAAFRRP
jgi:hypothetical protein